MAQAFNLTAQLNLRGPSNIRQIVADVKKQIGTISGDIKFNIDPAAINNTSKLNRSLQELNTNLSAVRANASAAANAIKNFGQSVSSVGNTSSKLSSNLSKAAKGADSLGAASTKTAKNISVARTEMEEFGRQSALAIRRFAAFSAVTGVFFSLNRAINSGLKSFIEFDKELVRLQQVTGKSAAGLKGLQDEITRLSIGLGVSSDSLIQVSSTLAQAGLSASETRSALEALARSSLAPSFDDMNQTVEGSIALMRQFGISAKELEKALGSVNAVAAAFAVESSDIIAAIQRTGGVFANASKGVSEGTDALNEFIAVFTSVRATTRESAETIATGLRTIFTRIQRQGTIEALREYGVSLTDVEGKFVGAYKAVQLLSEGLNRIDPRDIRFSQIVEELGGFRQIGKVIPLIQQFATAQEALKVAQAGQGSLAADALKAQLSLANQISKVREEFLALIRTLGQSDTFQTLARGALGFASGLIKITSALKGVLPALAILGAGASLRGITQFTGGFIGGLKKVPKGGQGGGDQNPSIARSIGANLGSSLVGAKTEQVSRDLDQNSAALDKVSGKLDNLASVISKMPTGPSIDPALLTNLTSGITTLNTNVSNLNTSLASYGSLLQNNTDGLSNNTSGLNNLYAAMVNLESTISNINFGGGGGPATVRDGGRILGFAKGGSVPGSGNTDSIPALLTPGEFVVNKKASRAVGSKNLHRINRYAKGGIAKANVADVQDGDTLVLDITPQGGIYQQGARVAGYDAYEYASDKSKKSFVDDTKLSKIKKIKGNETLNPRYNSSKKGYPISPDTKVTRSLTAHEAGKKARDQLASQLPKDTEINKEKLTTGGGFGRLKYTGGVKISEQYTTGRYAKMALGGKVQRNVGYIDYDVIANPANEAVVTKGMESSGVKGPRLYADYLTDLAVKARKESSLQKLRAVYGVAGSGKTTLARGQGTDQGKLRSTTRFPVLTPEDIQKANEVLILSSSVSKDKLDSFFSEVDRAYTLSSTTTAEKERIRSQRASRDVTGIGLEGRTPGGTAGVGKDTAVGEALLQDRLGSRSVVLGRSDSGNLRRKKGDELVNIIKKKIGFTWGGFAPMTAGHESILDAASAMGISPQDFIFLVGANEAIKGDAASYRTAIFSQDARVLLAKAGAGAKGATVLPKAADFEVPLGFDVSQGSGRRQVVLPGKGSKVFVGDKAEELTGKYKEAGYGVVGSERTGGISGTMVRDLIEQGNLRELQKVLSPGVYELISNNIGRIQNRARVLPEIISQVQASQAVKLADVEKAIKAVGVSRIDKKKLADPEYAAKVQILEELRGQRDKIKSAAAFEPYKLLDELARSQPDQYGLDFSTGTAPTAKPIRTVGATQRASIGGLIQRFMAGGEAEETTPWGDTATVPEILRLLTFSGAAKIGRVANPRELLKRKTPTEDEKAKIKAIRDEATKTYNRRIGAAKGVQTRLAGQGLKFAAVGMFGDTFPDETYDAQGTKGIRKVLITAAVMDKALAEQLDADFGGGIESIAQQAAEKTMVGNITKGLLGGKQLELDFDRTLAVGADDIASLTDFRDPTIVQEKLKRATLTRLGSSLVDLIKAHPELTSNMRVVTARSQSTVPLIQQWLADKGLALSDSQFVGVGGDAQIVSESDIPALKAAQLRTGSLFVDDSAANISAAEASGKNIETYQYGAQSTIPNPVLEAGVKGVFFEKMIQNLGGPGRVSGLGFDYPKGLGTAAKYFGIDPDIPTDAKRTIVGAGTIKDNVKTYLKAMGYKAGGKVSFGTGFPFPRRISNKYFKDMEKMLDTIKLEKAWEAYPKDERIMVDDERVKASSEEPFNLELFKKSFGDKISRDGLFQKMGQFARYIGLPSSDLTSFLPSQIDFVNSGGVYARASFSKDPSAYGGRGLEGVDLSEFGFSEADKQDAYGYSKLIEEKKKEVEKVLKTPVQTFDDGSFRYDETKARALWDEINDLKKKYSEKLKLNSEAIAKAKESRKASAEASGRGSINMFRDVFDRNKRQSYGTLYHEMVHQLFNTLRTRQADTFTQYKERVDSLFAGDNDDLADAFDLLDGGYKSADVVYGRSYKLSGLQSLLSNAYSTKSLYGNEDPVKKQKSDMQSLDELRDINSKANAYTKARDFRPINPGVNKLLLGGGYDQNVIDKMEDNGKEEFLTTLVQNLPKLDTNLQGVLDSTLNELLSSGGISRRSFAQGGLADATSEMASLMGGLYGNRKSSEAAPTKKQKDFGRIGLNEDGDMITASYYKNDKRSGYVYAYKMKDNLYNVGLSKATSGYGPRLYDVVMEAVSEKGAMLTSDRNMVSAEAQKVWQYYFKNRGDVKKTPLDPEDWTKNQSLIDPKLYGRKETWPPSTDPAWVLQSGYSKSPSLINDPNSVVRGKKKPTKSSGQMALEYFGRANGGILDFADGGSVPALVSNGEAYVPPKLAKKIGYGTLGKMNQADKNGMGRFSSGGISVFKGPGSGTSDSIPTSLPVGSFIIREKATKALGLNTGGVVQRFANGGSPEGAAPNLYPGLDTKPFTFLEEMVIKAGNAFRSSSTLIGNTGDIFGSLEISYSSLARALDEYSSILINTGQITVDQENLMYRAYEKAARTVTSSGDVKAMIDAEKKWVAALNSAADSLRGRILQEARGPTTPSAPVANTGIELPNTRGLSDDELDSLNEAERKLKELQQEKTRLTVQIDPKVIDKQIKDTEDKILNLRARMGGVRQSKMRQSPAQSGAELIERFKIMNPESREGGLSKKQKEYLEGMNPEQAKRFSLLEDLGFGTTYSTSGGMMDAFSTGRRTDLDKLSTAELEQKHSERFGKESSNYGPKLKELEELENKVKELEAKKVNIQVDPSTIEDLDRRILETTQKINDLNALGSSPMPASASPGPMPQIPAPLPSSGGTPIPPRLPPSSGPSIPVPIPVPSGGGGGGGGGVGGPTIPGPPVPPGPPRPSLDGDDRTLIESRAKAKGISFEAEVAQMRKALIDSAKDLMNPAERQNTLRILALENKSRLEAIRNREAADKAAVNTEVRNKIQGIDKSLSPNEQKKQRAAIFQEGKEKYANIADRTKTETSNIQDALIEQIRSISPEAAAEDLSKTIIDGFNKNLNLNDIIASSEGLKQVFNGTMSATDAQRIAAQKLAEQFGVTEAAAASLASAADIDLSKGYDDNVKALSRMSSYLAKGSLAVGAFATGLSSAIKMFGGENDRGSVTSAAGIEGFGSTVSTLGAALSQIPGTVDSVIQGMQNMGGGIGNLASSIGPKIMGLMANPFVAGGAIIGVAAVGIAAAFKEAHNAAREFDKALAAKNVENAMDKVAQAFDDFSKDVKRLDLLDNIKNELTIAGANVAEGIRIDAEVPKAMWVNLFDALGGGSEAAQRSMILEKQGIGAYLQSSAFGQNPLGMMANATLFGIPDAIAQAVTGQSMFQGSMDAAEENRNFYMQKMAPEMAKEQAAQFKPVADATLRLFEEKLRTGTSMQDIMGELKDASGAPTQLAKNIAQSNPVIQEQILRIRASNNLSDEQKAAMERNVIAQEAEYKARINLEATLRSMEIDKLNREMKNFVVSLERMFNNMDQSIERTSFELDNMSRSAELSSAALSGNAKSGEIALKSLNVLRNLDAYAPREREQAVNQAAGFFGSQADVVAPLIGLGNKLEKTVLSTVNREIEKNPEATNERIAAGIRSALDKNLRDLGLPDNLTDKLSNQVQKAFAEISKSGTDAKDVSFDEIVEQVPAFADAISASRKAEELAIKALEFYQKNLNDYANAMNQMVDYQIEANSRFRRASDIQTQGLLKLNQTFGKSASLFEQQQIINQQTASLTGGATNPAAIGQNILNLENTRSQLQSMSDTAASRGPGGRDEFMLMQNRLRNVNVSLRENYEALKQMADSTEMAEAAMNKIQEVQAKRQAGMNLLEKVVTSDPGEVAKLNNSIARLSNNMAGRTNLSTSEQRGEDLQTFNMIAPLLGEGQRQNELRANVLESMLKESGQGVNPLFAQVIDSLRNPEADPEMQEAIAYYKSSLAQQSQANMMLGQIQQLMAQNTAEIAAEKLAHSIEGVKLNFETQVLNEIRDGIWKLVERAGANPAGMSVGGIVYASAGQMINFQPKGTDTVPAMLTPGEFVVNRRSAQANLPLLQNINSGNYNKGGKVSYYADGGLVIDQKWKPIGMDFLGADYNLRDTQDLVTSQRYPVLDKNTLDYVKPDTGITTMKSVPVFELPNTYYATSAESKVIGPFAYGDKASPSLAGANFQAQRGISYEGVTIHRADITPTDAIFGSNLSFPKYIPSDAQRNRAAKRVGLIPEVDFLSDTIFDGDEIRALPIRQPDFAAVQKNYKDILDYYDNRLKLKTIKEIVEKNQKPKSPNFQSQVETRVEGRNYALVGLTYTDRSSPGLLTKDPSILEAAGVGIGNIFNFRQEAMNGGTQVVAGIDNFSSVGSLRGGGVGGALQYGRSFADLSTPYTDIESQMSYLNNDIAKNSKVYSNIETALETMKKQKDFIESESSLGIKKYLADLEALYNRNTFRAKFDQDQPFNKPGVEFPITLYNMEKNKWKQILQQQDIIGDTGYKNIDDANKFALSEDHFIAISQKDPATGTPKNTRKLPWVSNAFNTVKNASEQIFTGSQTAFGVGGEDGLVKLISRTSEAYNVAPFNFTYDQVTGKLYDTISKAFVGDPLNYIIVKPQDQTSKFPLAELLSINNKSLYADSIDVLLANLKNNTPIYDVLSGIDTAPPGQPFKYSLNGENIGLIDPSLFAAEIPDTYKMSLTDQDKASVITSTSGRKNIIPVENFFAENYQKKREQDIKNVRSLIAKTKTATVDRQKVTADEAKFSEPIRLSIARAVQPLLSKNLADGTGIKISATPPDKISQVGMIAGRLAQEATDINDVTSPRRSIIDAWRALYVDLYKPANPAQTAEYLKNLGIPVDRKLYGDPVRVNEGGLDKISYYRKTPISPETILTAINREIALIRSKAFAGGDVDIEVSDKITDLAEGAILHDVDPKTGLKSGTNPKGKQPSYAGAATWPDVHKMALTPENLFSGPKTRLNIIDILKEYYTKASDKKGRKLYDQQYTDALDQLREWYNVQDSILYKGLSVEKIKNNIQSLQNDKVRSSDIDNLQKKATQAHLLLTGNIYGSLPTSSRLITLLEARILEKEEELKEEAKQAGLPEGTPQLMAKGGVVPMYASGGALVNFQPKGTDTVPAMLTPGEFVINRESTQKYKPVLEAINSGNYNRGGIVNYLNKGGYIPEYKFFGGLTGAAQSIGQSFDFTKYLNGLMGSITSSITEAFDKALSNLKQPNNAAGGVSNTSGDIASIDNFVNRLNNIANILSNIYIPPQITITGKHDVVVTINGDTVLNQLRPDIAGIVVSAIKGAFRDLKAKNPENNTINFNIDIDPRSLT